MEQDLLGLAVRYGQAGYSVIPIRGDGSKAPALAWSVYQTQAPTTEQLRDWFDPQAGRYRHDGLALVCGAASGGFEVLDFDVVEAFAEFRQLLAARGLTSLLQRVSLTHTPRPGVHLGLRSQLAGRNQVLARRPRGQVPLRSDLMILCETRGQGGYVLAPGCPGRCHPRGGAYRSFDDAGVPLHQLGQLTVEERAALLETARLLEPGRTELGNPPDEIVVSPHRSIGRPGDLFNRNGPPWSQLLEPAGWVLVNEDSHGIAHWRRPGKRRLGTSATVSSHYSSYGEELFYVFSTKAAPFEPGTAYSKFAVWALLQHGGDFKAAARALARSGFAAATSAPSLAEGQGSPPPLAVSREAASGGGEPLGSPGSGPTLPRQVQTIRLSSVRPAATKWIWYPWLPAGTLTILDGDPGLGKSTLTLDLAARLTRGATLPFEETGSGEPESAANVLLLSAEDDAARTIQPRLLAAGADLDRVHLLGTVRDALGERMPELPGDLDAALTRIPGVRLVVVDPLMAFLGEQFDACRDQNVRRCLFALARLAERHQAALLLVRHLNKNGNGAAIYRGSGSIGILGAARACLLAGRDPDQPEQQCVLAMSKCNLAARPRSLAYALKQAAGGVATIEWRGPVAWTADDLVGKVASESRQTQVQECAAWLRQVLALGPLPSTELEQRCLAHGWSRGTYDRARQTAGVRSEKESYSGAWISVLATVPPPASPAGRTSS